MRESALLKRPVGTLKSSTLTRNTCCKSKASIVTPLHWLIDCMVSPGQSAHSHKLAGQMQRLFQERAGYLLLVLLTHHTRPEPRPSYRSVCQALARPPLRVQASLSEDV